MHYRVVNNNNNDPNNKIYEEAVSFYLKKLLKRKKIKSGIIRVDIKAHAKMYDLGECFTRKLKNGDITVRVKFKDNITFIDAIVTLAHECVHAAQFMTGKLRITDKIGNWYWNKDNYGNDPYGGLKDVYVLPWEKEAYDKELCLRKEFLEYYLDYCVSY